VPSTRSGVTWSELTVPVENQYNDWTVHCAGGALAVIGSDGQVHVSTDSGDTFTPAPLPVGTLVDFANHGQNLYAVMDDGVLQVSPDGGSTWEAASTPSPARAIEALPNGDVILSGEAVAIDVGLVHRSSDRGQTWTRERGAHNDARMAFAFGMGDERMMVTTRGTFRYSTGAPLDIGVEPPPLGGSGGTPTGGNGGSGPAGMGGASTGGASGSATTSGGGGGGAGGPSGGGPSGGGSSKESSDEPADGGGCGCRTTPAKPASAYGLALLALAWFARRRRAR